MKLFLIVVFLAVIAFASAQDQAHQTISLDNFLPEQLRGLLNNDWKQQLTGQLKDLVGSFKLPNNQLTQNIFRRHFMAMNAAQLKNRHRLSA